MSAPLVSVIVPTRNRADVLPRAVASVLAQTMDDLELIVVDDGSTDSTAVERAGADDPRVVWIDGPHRGVSAARNRAVAIARGRWLAFLDDDNEWMPDHLERQLATAARTGADLVHCRAVERALDGRTSTPDPPPASDPVIAATCGWAPFTSCVLVRRDAVLRAGGFPEHLSHSEDRYLWMRLAFDVPWAATPAVLMMRHRHPTGGLSTDAASVRAANAELERTFHAEVRRRAGIVAEQRWHWAYRGRAEFTSLMAQTPARARAAAWRSVRAQARDLPRSTVSLVRPLLVLALGQNGYRKARRRYHLRHRRLADRRRPRRAA